MQSTYVSTAHTAQSHHTEKAAGLEAGHLAEAAFLFWKIEAKLTLASARLVLLKRKKRQLALK